MELGGHPLQLNTVAQTNKKIHFPDLVVETGLETCTCQRAPDIFLIVQDMHLDICDLNIIVICGGGLHCPSGELHRGGCVFIAGVSV